MILKCDTVQDLLPLYLDEACSTASREYVEEHLAQCSDCREVCRKMKGESVERPLEEERGGILLRQAKRMRRRNLAATLTVGCIFGIPVLVCLIVNLAVGHALDWFFIVLASLLLCASVTVLPFFLRQNRFAISFGAATDLLIALLGTVCLYTGGDWFAIATFSTLFGLSVVFLPILLGTGTLRACLNGWRGLLCMTADTVLYAAMLTSIGVHTESAEFATLSVSISLPFAVLVWGIFLILRYLPAPRTVRAGVVCAVTGTSLFFMNFVIGKLINSSLSLPAFHPLRWDVSTLDGNVKWIIFLVSLAVGAILFAAGLLREKADLKGGKKQ